MTGTAKVKVDTTEAIRELDELRQVNDITAQSVVNTARKGYQSLALLADLFGVAIPMWFNLMASAAFMAAETFTQLAAAETISGWMAAKAVVTYSLAAAMYFRAITLQNQATQIEQKLNTIVQLSNVWM